MREFRERIARIVESRMDEGRVNPSWIATEVMKEWDPNKELHPFIYYGCHEYAIGVVHEMLGTNYPRVEDNPLQDADAYRRAAEALAKHADALQAWWDEKQTGGLMTFL
jgi:hypothetical protein